MKAPDNERTVLTWVRDCQGLEGWQIDSYLNKSWLEADAWHCTVLSWQELPPKPNLKDVK